MVKNVASSLETTFAGLKFRSPIGVGPVGRPEGANLTAELHAKVLLKHAEAGAGYIYIPTCLYVTDGTIRRIKERAKPITIHPKFPPATRTIKAVTPAAPYGDEGIYTLVTFPTWTTIERSLLEVKHLLEVLQIVKKKKPAKVRIIANSLGFSDLPESYGEAARFWEEQGVDLIEVNLACPAQPAMAGAVDDYFDKTFSFRYPGSVIGQIPEMVENITKEVVKAVKIPVGVKLSAEIGFPPIVGFARAIRDAGARFITVVNCAVTIAPPDIYNHGRPLYPFVDGNAFCGGSGSWLRQISYRDIAAIARFAPGIDIAAAGGAVIPQHCIEMMMLGARLTEVTTGVIEQGRGLLRRCNTFLEKFMMEQGYSSTEEIIGLGQQYIKYLEEVDMSGGKIKAITDRAKCTNCGICTDTICIVRFMENGELKVKDEDCTGCGTCLVACPQGAIRLEKIA